MRLVSRASSLLPEIEAARPRCSSGISALCSFNQAIEKVKLVLQHCSEYSKLYLVSVYCRNLGRIGSEVYIQFWPSIEQLRFIEIHPRLTKNGFLLGLLTVNLLHIFLCLYWFQVYTADAIILRCERYRKMLELSLIQLQNNVPVLLAIQVKS